MIILEGANWRSIVITIVSVIIYSLKNWDIFSGPTISLVRWCGLNGHLAHQSRTVFKDITGKIFLFVRTRSRSLRDFPHLSSFAALFVAIALVIESGVTGLAVGIDKALSIGIFTGDGILVVAVSFIQLISGIILAVAAIYLALNIFERLTLDVKEFGELKKGNIAIALEMAGLIITVAMVIQVEVLGITTALREGLLWFHDFLINFSRCTKTHPPHFLYTDGNYVSVCQSDQRTPFKSKISSRRQKLLIISIYYSSLPRSRVLTITRNGFPELSSG
jgi:hypothetical protein